MFYERKSKGNTFYFQVSLQMLNLQCTTKVIQQRLPTQFSKKENARFYEIKHFGKDDMQVSHEVFTVVKNRNGQVVSGTHRKRCGKQWVTVRANVSTIYDVFRRRASHVTDRKSFVRYITFMMCMKTNTERNENQGEYSSETQTKEVKI